MDGINTAVRAGPPVNDLVTRAGNGDKQAWDTLVERYAPLIWSICRRYRLSSADANDVGQRVWLQLVSQLDTDPRSRRTPRLAGYRDPAGMRPADRNGRARAADGRAACSAARGVHPPAPMLPAADRRAHGGSTRAVRPDQRQAGHPDREHRAKPPPLPGQAAPRSGDHRSARRHPLAALHPAERQPQARQHDREHRQPGESFGHPQAASPGRSADPAPGRPAGRRN